MFDSTVYTVSHDTGSSAYQDMLARIERQFGYLRAEGRRDITGQQDFIGLHELTRGFYAHAFAAVYRDYVPLYHSIWKLRLRDVRRIDNIHQDGGVHYFSRNGYQSRMLTIWTNVYRDAIPGLDGSDMGIFVVDNKDPAHADIYQRMERENTHFISKKKGELSDCMYLAGPVLRCDTDRLKRSFLDYREGMSIVFNSHLLHGSKSCDKDLGALPPADLDKFRVSLTSVWIHKDDLDLEVMDTPEAEHERIYLSRLEPEVWPDVKSYFADACALEHERLVQTKRLIRHHLSCAAQESATQAGCRFVLAA
ncbi:hypothetical protein ACLB1G_25795 [Oxalobacteraceae bacterium A2-2]